MSETVLVFPANPAEALAFARQRRALGQPVLGATAQAGDPILAACYARVLSLPHLSETAFDAAFTALIAAEGITRVVTSQTAVWGHLVPICAELGLKLELIASLPQQHLYALCRDWAAAWPDGAEAWPPPLREEFPDPVPLLYRALSIPGHSSPAKLLGLMRVLARAVPGDLVEIGVLWGRSAWLLAALGRHYGLGPFLGVDPWPVGGFAQQSPVLDAQTAAARDFEAIYQACCAVLWPDLAGQANLLRLPSREAVVHYGSGRAVSHPLLGETAYQGRISVLHIDGSHAHREVSADLAAWRPYLAPGAWVVIDDYRWDFGEGPRLAADAFVAMHNAALEQVFEQAGSLYLRFAD